MNPLIIYDKNRIDINEYKDILHDKLFSLFNNLLEFSNILENKFIFI
jgi:hypothetical protein